MSKYPHSRKSEGLDNVIPFKQEKMPSLSTNDDPLEVLFIRTEKIFFILMILQDEAKCYHAKGHVTFASGESLFVSLKNSDYQQVKEKSDGVAQRMARIYRGVVEKMTIKSDGHCHYIKDLVKE